MVGLEVRATRQVVRGNEMTTRGMKAKDREKDDATTRSPISRSRGSTLFSDETHNYKLYRAITKDRATTHNKYYIKRPSKATGCICRA
jgi:hypothetical protein